MNRNQPSPPLPKVYVPVKADFDADGNIRPYEITWEDGTRYQIDRVLDVRQAAAMRSGGQGDRYTVVIQGEERYLYYERPTELHPSRFGRWFVQSAESA